MCIRDRRSFAINLSATSLRNQSHHLTHLSDGIRSRLSDHLVYQFEEFLLSHLAGKEFLYQRSLGLFLVRRLRAPARTKGFSRLLPLFLLSPQHLLFLCLAQLLPRVLGTSLQLRNQQPQGSYLLLPSRLHGVRSAYLKLFQKAHAKSPNPAPPTTCTCRSVSYTHLRAHETVLDLVCRLL